MPDLVIIEEVPIRVDGAGHDRSNVSIPVLADFFKLKAIESALDTRGTFGVRDHFPTPTEQRIIREPRVLDGLHETRPNLVVPAVVLSLHAWSDLEGVAEAFHRIRTDVVRPTTMREDSLP